MRRLGRLAYASVSQMRTTPFMAPVHTPVSARPSATATMSSPAANSSEPHTPTAKSAVACRGTESFRSATPKNEPTSSPALNAAAAAA